MGDGPIMLIVVELLGSCSCIGTWRVTASPEAKGAGPSVL